MASQLAGKTASVKRCVEIFAREIRAYNRFPMRDYSSYGRSWTLQNVVFELANAARFVGGGNNMFNPSLALGVYGRLDPGLKAYFDLMVSGKALSEAELPRKIVSALDELTAAGLAERRDGRVRFLYRLVEFEGVSFVTDMYSRNEDMVWLSADSLNTGRMVAKIISRHSGSIPAEARIVDLCCGSGLVGLYTAKLLGPKLGGIGGLDINPRAVELVKLNCALNGFGDGSGFVTASIYDHVFSEPFDVIVSNPAYGSSPYELERLCHRSGSTGIEQVLAAFEHAQRRLKEGGLFIVMGDSPVDASGPLLARELERLSAGSFDLDYEVLYDYDATGMRIKAAESGPDLNHRQRVIIYGRRAPGSVRVSRNRTFNLFHHF